MYRQLLDVLFGKCLEVEKLHHLAILHLII